jgi:hypothetical protein
MMQQALVLPSLDFHAANGHALCARSVEHAQLLWVDGTLQGSPFPSNAV